MVGVAVASRKGGRVTVAADKPCGRLEGVRFQRSGPGPASPDLWNDNIGLVTEDVEDPPARFGQIEQSGDVDRHEDEPLHRAPTEAALAVSVDSVRVYLKQIGRVALVNAEQEVELGKRIEVGLFAAERLRRAKEMGDDVSPQLRRDLRW